MLNKKEVIKWGTYAEDGPDEYKYIYTCWVCVMRDQDFDTQAQAKAYIVEQSPGYQGRKRRAEAHKDAVENIKEQFPLMTEWKTKRTLTRDNLKNDLLAPVFTYVVRKSQQKDSQSELMARYAKLIKEFAKCTCRDQIDAMTEEMIEVDRLLGDSESQLSYAGWSEPTRKRFALATDYCDCLWEIKGADKKTVIGYAAAYYICAHDWTDQGHGKCLTLILSKDWCNAYNDDPMHKHQRWHCNICAVRQRPWMGMLLEIWMQDEFLYAKIDVKDFEVKDVQGMYLEDNIPLAQRETPEKLYASLKRQKPNEGSHIRQATEADFWKEKPKSTDGVYIISKDWYEELENWEWKHLFTYGKEDAEGYKLKGGARPVGVNPNFTVEGLKTGYVKPPAA